MSDLSLFTDRAPERLRAVDALLSEQIAEDERHDTPSCVPHCVATERVREGMGQTGGSWPCLEVAQ